MATELVSDVTVRIGTTKFYLHKVKMSFLSIHAAFFFQRNAFIKLIAIVISCGSEDNGLM